MYQLAGLLFLEIFVSGLLFNNLLWFSILTSLGIVAIFFTAGEERGRRRRRNLLLVSRPPRRFLASFPPCPHPRSARYAQHFDGGLLSCGGEKKGGGEVSLPSLISHILYYYSRYSGTRIIGRWTNFPPL